MQPDAHNTSGNAEVEQIAGALVARGQLREAVAMLRGAVARDKQADGCRELLGRVLEGERPDATGLAVELDLPLVDRWIRAGMLVEALALLGGTTMGSRETGREWANLLGELLAPVPSDADRALRDMHRQLLSGGVSVALTILEERSRRTDKGALPAWALRRLEVLRWMLLDNASTAEAAPDVSLEGHTLISMAIRGPLNQRDFPGALEAAQGLVRIYPENRDAARTAEALETILLEIERHKNDPTTEKRTIPMFGHPAAAMQLRMGNLRPVCAVYRKLIEKFPDDDHARLMLAEVEAVIRALDAEDEPFREEATVVAFGGETEPGESTAFGLDTVSHPLRDEEVSDAALSDAALSDAALSHDSDEEETRDDTIPPPAPVSPHATFSPDLSALAPPMEAPIPVTAMTRLPEVAERAEASRRVRIADSGLSEATVATPGPRAAAEQLVAEGRVAEAEAMLRGFAELFPHDSSHLERANELRRMLGPQAGDGVIVRRILSVK